jgi:hypothetical protein
MPPGPANRGDHVGSGSVRVEFGRQMPGSLRTHPGRLRCNRTSRQPARPALWPPRQENATKRSPDASLQAGLIPSRDLLWDGSLRYTPSHWLAPCLVVPSSYYVNHATHGCVCLAVTLTTGQPEMQGDYVIGGGELACSIDYGGWRSQSM